MLNTLFQGLFYTTAITVPQFMLCIASSLAIGLFLAFIYTRQSSYTSSFLIRRLRFRKIWITVNCLMTFFRNIQADMKIFP